MPLSLSHMYVHVFVPVSPATAKFTEKISDCSSYKETLLNLSHQS